MKFWLIDMEKEFSFINLSRKANFLGILGYGAMLTFILFFLLTRSESSINPTLMGICFGGIILVLSVATFCKIHKKINSRVIPSISQQNDMENLSSFGSVPETEISKKKTEFSRYSSDVNSNPNIVNFKLLSGIFLTILTLIFHSFLYVYIMSCSIPQQYHLIFMVNIAFPVTICLIIFTLISANILYNLWVDVEFGYQFLKKADFIKIFRNIYVVLGYIFIFFAYISALFSSFCGTVNGDSDSTIVFIVFLLIVSIPIMVKLINRLIKKIWKCFMNKNN